MTWIARTDGATSGQATELREGELTDIAPSDRDNWRVVDESSPPLDSNVETRAITGLPIAGDGTVSVTWTFTPLPAALAKLRLEQLAKQLYEGKLVAARITRAGKQIGITDGEVHKLTTARLEIDNGASTAVVRTSDGDLVAATGTVIDSVLGDVMDARAALGAAWADVVVDIRSETVTGSNAVSAHASWPG